MDSPASSAAASPRPAAAATGARTILYCHHHAEISGGETSLLELFRHLDRGRFRPLLAGPAAGPFPEAARALGVEVFGVPFAPLRRAGALLRNALRLRRIARASGAALLHANSPATNLPAALAGRTLGLPVVWHARTLPEPGEVDLDRLFLFMTTLLIANSDATRERFRYRGRLSPKALTIHNGVDTARFHPGICGEAPRARLGAGPGDLLIGVIGRIAPLKGQRTFIEAAADLLARHPRLRFALIGAGLFPGEKAHEEALREAVRERGLEGSIRFAGHQRDVRAWTAALDICAVPSERESCPRVVFEAMALAKPVVGTRSGGTPEIIAEGETGLLVPPGDAGALAAALERLAGDGGLRRRMGEAGRRRVETRFPIEANVRRTEAAYLELIEGRPVHG